MKLRTALCAGAMVLLFGGGTSLYAQEQQDKPAQQDEKPPAPKPDDKQPKPTDAKPPKHPDEQKPPENGDKVNPPNKANPPAQGKQTAKSGNQAEARGGNRIPDDKYRAHFGAEHRFKVGKITTVSGGGRFQYSGYWFELSQPWPTGWAYTDEVYIIFVDGGYYLCDPNYPGVQLAIVVVV